jgi:hypothetical protein
MPGTGVNLWGESPLCANPVMIFCFSRILT